MGQTTIKPPALPLQICRATPHSLGAWIYRQTTRALLGTAVLLLAACVSIPTAAVRRQEASALAERQHWHATELTTSTFKLQAFTPDTLVKNARLTIYLEGDGFAWISTSQPSADPTPLNPLALRLALAQPAGNAAYLARPCQYVADPRHCAQRYWTNARFAEEVVASLDQAISTLKTEAGAQRLTLVGYSGGAALALLLAARRDDIHNIITVAGNLDPGAWTEYHHVRPLDESLSPADHLAALAKIRQTHLVGADDTVTPASLAQRFIAAYPKPHQARVNVVRGYTHSCCWAEQWPTLWRALEDSGD